jgi:hypothetical protein
MVISLRFCSESVWPYVPLTVQVLLSSTQIDPWQV